jgi:hypothetical protein
MAVQKIKKTAVARRRFIQSRALPNLETWMDEGESLKHTIVSESTYQLVGDKTILSINSKTQHAHVLIEVLGIPQLGLSYVDMEAVEVLVCELPETVFSVDFLTLKERAEALKQKIAHSLEDSYHIVFEANHLALHFFMQKDYIQS